MTPSDFLRVTLFGWLITAAGGAYAAEDVPAATLQGQADAFVRQQLLAQFGPEKTAQDIEFTLGALDARLKLPACAQPVQFAFLRTPLVAGLSQLKVQCPAPVAWGFTLPVRLTLFAKVAVAARTLARGQLLQAADIRWQRVNLAHWGPNAVDRLEPWQGFELKRPLAEGEALRSVYLTMPKVIRTGDTLRLQADAEGFSVNTQAIALTDGYVGGSIRVKNTQTQRMLTAQVVSPGVARIQTLPAALAKKS